MALFFGCHLYAFFLGFGFVLLLLHKKLKTWSPQTPIWTKTKEQKTFKAHFRWASRIQIPTNQFGLIWSKLNPLSWILALDPHLHLGSPNHELSLSPLSSFLFFGCHSIDFLSKMVPYKFSLDLPLFWSPTLIF